MPKICQGKGRKDAALYWISRIVPVKQAAGGGGNECCRYDDDSKPLPRYAKKWEAFVAAIASGTTPPYPAK